MMSGKKLGTKKMIFFFNLGIKKMHKEEFSTWAKNIPPFHIPELVRDKEGNLENKVIKKYAFLENNIEIFNHWVDNLLDIEIRAKVIKTEHGIISFSLNRLEKPSIIINSTVKPLFPKMARDKSLSYMGALYLNAHFEPFEKSEKEAYSTVILFGKIPILTGSKYCNLHSLTIDEFIEAGECPNDTLGYNIVKGLERVIVIQEKLRESQFLSFIHSDQEAKIEGRITCSSPSGTNVVIMNVGKQWNTLKVKLSHIKGNIHIPLFILFYFLGVDIKDAIDMILTFIPESDRQRAEISLAASVAKTEAHRRDPVGYWRIKRNINSDLKPEEVIKTIIDDINSDLFSNIPIIDNSVDQYKSYLKALKKYRLQNQDPDTFIPIQVPQISKAKQLALMASKMIQVLNNRRKYDNRDSWSNKMLKTAASSYETLFITMYDIFIKKSTVDIVKMKNADGSLMISKISNHHGIITEQSETCFNSNSWGIKGLRRQENITNLITRESPLSVLSQLKKVNTPTSRKAKSEGIRALQGSQFGILCVAETPEGQNCGLVKAMSMTSIVSLERSTDDIVKFIFKSHLFSEEFPNETPNGLPYPFLINGKIMGWAQIEIIDQILLRRRSSKLPKDVCILFNNEDNLIEYYCDANRPVRPLLIVENRKLLIDELDLWDASLDDLFSKGVMELVDIKELEQENKRVAFSPKDIRREEKEVKTLKEKKKKLRNKRLDLEDSISDQDYRTYLSYFLKLKSKEQINKVSEALSLLPKNLNPTEFKERVQNSELSNKKDLITGLNLIIRLYSSFDLEELELDIQNTLNNFETLEHEFKVDFSLDSYEKRQPFTHSEIHPINMFSISSALIPQANKNQAARITYQASMGKQSSGQYSLNHHIRFEAFKMLNKPVRPYFESEVAEPVGFNVMPSGQPLTLAIYSDPFNMEDSFIGCKEYFENENFENIKWMVYKTSRKHVEGVREEFRKPSVKTEKEAKRYHGIDDYGIPIIGTFLKEGECVIGKVRYLSQTEDSSRKEENASIFMGVKEEGYVERVLIIENADKSWTVKVKVGKLRIQQPGDKMSSRYSQKGTFAQMRLARDMIRVASGPNKGVVPNLMINSNAIPTRMTLGKITEILSSKGFLYDFKRVNGTTFNEFSIEDTQKTLEENGLDKFGNEQMCHPNGKLLEYPVFFGVCFYQSLRHHVDDKIQIRARGDIRPISHQPVKGRDKRGGLRLGEMERDALIASGGSSILNERLMIVSDKYRTVFCSNCGNFAVSDNLSHKKNKNSCGFCNKNAEFGVLTFPYIYKLIYNMLLGVNINIKHGLKYNIEQGGSILEECLL